MPFLCSRALRACLIHAVLCIAFVAQAQPVEFPVGELTLAEAIAAALARNPELRVGEFELRASAGRIQQSRLRPNPELAFELENFAGSGVTSGSDVLETTLTLSQVVELGAKRDARQQVASHGREVLIVQRRIRQLDVLTEVTRRYLEVVLAQERLALSQTALDLADQTHAVMLRRVKAARSPRAEQIRTAITRTRSRLALERSRQVLDASRVQLAATWGADQARFTTAVADLYALPAMDAVDTLASRLLHVPDFRYYVAEQRLRESELELARAQARPNLKLAAGIRRLEATDDTALVAGLSLPVPLLDRRQGRRAESRSRIAKVRAERSAALVKARSTLSSLHGELRVVRAEVKVLRGELLPQTQDALDQIRSGFERGRFSYLELASAQQDVLDTERAAISAAGTAHRLHTEIERLTGGPLTAATPTR